MRRTAFTAALSLALLAGGGLAAPAATTAPDLLDEVIYELAQNYYGPAKFRASDLSKAYRPKVREACAKAAKAEAKAAAACPSNVAYPLIEEMLKGVGDKHTNFLTPEELEESELAAGDEAKLSPSLGAIMLEVSREEGADFDGLVVLEVIPDTPAAKAGWQVGDVVTAFNGFSFPMDKEKGGALLETLEDGKPITFTMQRRGKPLTSEVVETVFKKPAVNLTLLDERTALLRLRHFDRLGIGQEVHDAVREAEAAGVTGLILDLRRNTGGYSAESLLATGAFTQPAPQVNRMRYFSETETYKDGQYLVDGELIKDFTIQNPVRFAGRMVVLVDDSSASAAEYLARDLQARPDTTVLGMTTVGVGNTGTLIKELSDGSGLQITVQQLEDENEQAVAAQVVPDIELELDVMRLAQTGQDNVLEKARELLE